MTQRKVAIQFIRVGVFLLQVAFPLAMPAEIMVSPHHADLTSSQAGSFADSHLDKKVSADICDGSLDEFRLIEAGFILSDIANEDSLRVYLGCYDQLLFVILAFHSDPFERVTSTSKVFFCLHAT